MDNRDELGTQIEQALETFTPGPVAPESIASRAKRRRVRRRGLWSAGVGIVAATLVAVLISTGPSDSPLGVPTVQASAEAELPGAVVTTVSDGRYLWVLTCSANCTGSPVEQISKGSVVKVESETGAIIEAAEVEGQSLLAVGEGSVWTASARDGSVTKFNPETLATIGRVQLSLPKPIASEAADATAFLPNAINVGEGSIWVTTARQYAAQIDPRSLEIEQVTHLPFSPAGMAIAHGSVWLSAELFGLGRIDANSGELEPTQPIGDGSGYRLSADYLTSTSDALWVRGAWVFEGGNGEYVPHPQGDLGLVRVDPLSGQVEAQVSFQPYLVISAASGSRLWLSAHDSPEGTDDIYVLDSKVEAPRLVAHLNEPGTIIGAVGDSLWIARSGHAVERYEIPVG